MISSSLVPDLGALTTRLWTNKNNLNSAIAIFFFFLGLQNWDPVSIPASRYFLVHKILFLSPTIFTFTFYLWSLRHWHFHLFFFFFFLFFGHLFFCQCTFFFFPLFYFGPDFYILVYIFFFGSCVLVIFNNFHVSLFSVRITFTYWTCLIIDRASLPSTFISLLWWENPMSLYIFENMGFWPISFGRNNINLKKKKLGTARPAQMVNWLCLYKMCMQGSYESWVRLCSQRLPSLSPFLCVWVCKTKKEKKIGRPIKREKNCGRGIASILIHTLWKP